MIDDHGITRRRALGWLGAGPIALLPFARTHAADGGAPVDCVLTPAQTEGPYFVDERLNRSDIRSDPTTGVVKSGVPLELDLHVHAVAARACAPIANALVDIWHCDAAGVYSDVDQARGRKFLRGYQVSDTAGRVRFVTIFPGWYPGRTAHIHFKVRSDGVNDRGYELTSQLYFDDAVSERVYAYPAYGGAARQARRTRNEADFVYRSGGKSLMLPLVARDGGYAARFDIGVRVG